MSGMALETAEGRFASLTQQMSKWVDQVLGPTYHNYCPSSWSPSINFYEDPREYCVVVDLAGVKAGDILRIEDDKLVISGSRSTPGLEQLVGPVRVHHMEIDQGRFRRALALPNDVERDAIQANYSGGFLWIRLPKKS